ncbi:MAG: glycosyltransferase, partial [Natronospirillum sp.]
MNFKFIDDMAVAYNWADLVICRAGALTVWEIASAGLASIMVPYPHAVDDHQTENARFLTDAMAARMIPEEVLSVDKLHATVNELNNDREELISMARKARGLARPDAREVVGKLCLGVCNG